MASVSASIFSLPLPSWLQSSSLRAVQYDRKRKKTEDWTDDTGLDTTDASGTESVPAGQSLVLTPNESHQYRVAGLPLDYELPGGHFPHGPARDEHATPQNLPSRLLRNLPSLSTPIYPPQSAAQQGSLRLQHLSVLMAVLHRCLLQGDFIRAGRAWGLILREEFRGYPVDVRHDERWGIGAEILLRCGQQSVVPNGADRTPLPFTKKGFAQAKEYYEKLILQHPFSRTVPHSVSSLHFYPAMFGLWVYVTQEESNSAQRDLMLGDSESDDGLSDDGSLADSDEWRESRRHKLTARLRVHEMEQAQQIATRMDSLLGSPPYSDSAELLELRGMVSLWIGDLLVSSLATPPVNDNGFDPDAMTDDLPGTFEERRAQRLATEQRQLEVQKSREFFARAQKRGRGVSYNLEHLNLDEGSPIEETEMHY
ncbi:hypothetical protein N7492_005263 [Penicillium capsulatum]|uniref:Transcription initiation factor Rrn11 n=1 Tax=Penicillium capsulatum TaxID=69766 RepID=A0A9W9IBY6_9EURO|nr:hypothetical protein N7492_005263 [Penicillium capsulatum]KAJ6135631.1 hypothetical protein N7512_000791 [Penicillium capsulatum]